MRDPRAGSQIQFTLGPRKAHVNAILSAFTTTAITSGFVSVYSAGSTMSVKKLEDGMLYVSTHLEQCLETLILHHRMRSQVLYYKSSD